MQNSLCKIYFGIEAPKNYATDILLNKGNMYLYKH